MRVLRGCIWILFVVGVVLPDSFRAAQPAKEKKNKVIIYPAEGDSIAQLRQQGIAKVDDYGSYWLAETTDEQSDLLKRTRRDRVVPANYLNRIELQAKAIDTTAGEPEVPVALQQTETGGRRLRLIQFKGPIRPEWLEQVKAAGNIRVINYVPNNAYIVWLDAAAERQLRALLDPNGPLQWVGAYHPYYKISQDLLTVEMTEPIKVRVAVVDDVQEQQTLDGVQKLGSVQSSLVRNGQEIIQMDIWPSAISLIAQLPGALWIEKVAPKGPLDEVQDLVLASQTNGPGQGPSPNFGITNYLSFLINTVGGGLGSFQNPATYPVVDIADTGLDNGGLNTVGLTNGVAFFGTIHPAFYYLGNTNLFSRVVYFMPQWVAGDPLESFGCQTRINENAFRFIEAEDISTMSHGTRVASIVAGYDTGTNIVSLPSLVLETFSSNMAVSVTCPVSGTTNLTVSIPTGVTNVCGGSATSTNITFSVTAADCTGTVMTNVDFTQVVTNFLSETRRDSNGFQLGMGVSPFGLIGVNRIFPQIVTTDSRGDACIVTLFDSTECMNDLAFEIAFAYSGDGRVLGARIQNNSWADFLSANGANGGLYTSDSQTYDIGVRDALSANSSPTPGPSPLNQEFIVVFACNANLGDFGVNGNAGGFGDIRLTAPATAKNVISVGSSVNPRNFGGGGLFDGGACWPPLTEPDQRSSLEIADFSANGPTVDGRFKPEIVAPGSSVYGALSQIEPTITNPASCSVDQLIPTFPSVTNSISPSCTTTTRLFTALYSCENGSSYAAPAVSGSIQLLWWYFQNRLRNEQGQLLLQPSPAMAKAYLCNSARYLPVTNPQTGAPDTLPSIAQGMGELDLLRMFDSVSRVIRDESAPRAIDTPLITTNPAVQQTYFTATGQTFEWTGEVDSNGLPFRVSLAWTDVPGDPANFIQLVNNLDLEVTIGGKTYRGNVFIGPNSISTDIPNPRNLPDTINVMESVFLPTGGAVTSGAPYRVVVRATNIAGDGVPNVGPDLDQDFAIVMYNARTNLNVSSDVPNLNTNDVCQTAQVITNFPFSATLANFPGTAFHNCHPSPTAGRGGAEGFWRIFLPTAGTVFNVNTTGSSFNTLLSVWKGNCGSLVEEVSNNNAPGSLQSALSFTSDGTNDYYIVAEGLNNAGGTLRLNVSATPPPVAFVPVSLDFGQVIVGTTGAVTSAVLTNASTQTVTVDTITLGGSDPGDFVIVEDGCTGNILPAGESCPVLLQFAPTATGNRSADLTETDNTVGSPRVLPLSGTGLPPAPVVCLSTNGPLNFTNQLVGTSSAAQTITLTNCGSDPLIVSSVSFTGAGAGDFSVVQTCTAGAISVGGTCTLNVTFTPTGTGNRVATLTINHNAAGGVTTVTVRGTGFVPAPAVCLSASSLNFGGIGVGTTSGVQSVTITNCGTANLVVSGIAITGTNAGEFRITGNSCGVVATGSTCVVSLVFNPTAGGTRSATLAITNNATGSPQLVTLVGAGSISQPDAAIGKSTKLKKMVGVGVINATGAGEEFTRKVRRNNKKVARFFIAYQNTGSSADQFNVVSDGSSGGFTVNYFLGTPNGADVTAGVTGSGYATTTMAPGAFTGNTSMIVVEVRADSTVPAGTTRTFTITFTSASDPTKVDAVRATVVAR